MSKHIMERSPERRMRSQWQPMTQPVEIPGFVGGWWRNVHDGELRVLITKHADDGGWHLSISHARHLKKGQVVPEPGRYPTWDEIADARYELLPEDLDFVMHLPPPSQYVALHQTTFHLHQHPPDGHA